MPEFLLIAADSGKWNTERKHTYYHCLDGHVMNDVPFSYLSRWVVKTEIHYVERYSIFAMEAWSYH